jgi:hypothetical protein
MRKAASIIGLAMHFGLLQIVFLIDRTKQGGLAEMKQ